PTRALSMGGAGRAGGGAPAPRDGEGVHLRAARGRGGDGERDRAARRVRAAPRGDPRRAAPVGARQAREGRRDGERAGGASERVANQLRITDCGLRNRRAARRIRNPKSAIRNGFSQVHAPRGAGVEGLGVITPSRPPTPPRRTPSAQTRTPPLSPSPATRAVPAVSPAARHPAATAP